MQNLLSELKRLKIDITPDFQGVFQRNDGQWFKGFTILLPSGEKLLIATYGNFKLGDDVHHWKSREPVGEGEAKLFSETLRAEAQEQHSERVKYQAETAKLCQELWETYSDRGSSPYFQRKGVGDDLYGCRLFKVADGLLTVVPATDLDGNILGFQYIGPEGSKRFKKGMRTRGACFLIGQPKEAKRIYLCEGVATGISIHQAAAQGSLVVCAFGSNNLKTMLTALVERTPSLEIIICGDDDRHSSTGRNTGTEAATDAWAMHPHTRLVFPRFPESDKTGTDFNDVHVSQGLNAVNEQLVPPAAHTQPEPEVDSPNDRPVVWLPKLTPLPWPVNERGKASPPPHQKIANALKDAFGDDLISEGHDLFLYTGTHWAHIDPLKDYKHLEVALQFLYSGKASAREIASMFKLFMVNVLSVPPDVQMFSPNPYCANFLNGTLHVVRGAGRKYELQFAPHRKENYLRNVLPYEYREGDTSMNEEFMAMLDRIFAGDEDAEEKKRTVRMLYGACLAPFSPQLFMLYGGPGTGKSTLMMILAKLIHADNLATVDPTHFEGFNLGAMVGKLVNMDTDICLTRPMADDQVKKIIDRRNFRIPRKYLSDLSAPLPAIHIFGGNDLPKSLDGASRAHDRRWTFIHFDKFVPSGNYDIAYHETVFNSNPQGLLNFAVLGLKDLLANGGHYVKPKSSLAAMDQWALRADPIGQFLAELKRGEISNQNVTLEMDEKGTIERKQFWEIFKVWYQGDFGHFPPWGKKIFFDTLRKKKIPEKCIKGVDYFSGFGVRGVENGDY